MSAHVCIDCDSPGDGNCPVCHGSGRTAGMSFSAAAGGYGGYSDDAYCDACGGSGHCTTCEGSGELEVGGEG